MSRMCAHALLIPLIDLATSPLAFLYLLGAKRSRFTRGKTGLRERTPESMEATAEPFSRGV